MRNAFLYLCALILLGLLLPQKAQTLSQPSGTVTCDTCIGASAPYLCFDSISRTYSCESAPQDIGNVKCSLCGATAAPLPTCTARPSCLDSQPPCLMAEPREGWCPGASPTPTSTQLCAQVVTPARNIVTRECQVFSSSCLPAGWIADPTCSTTGTAATSTPQSNSCALHSQGDVNCDGKIDLLDFNVWRDEFLSSFRAKSADLNSDGKVDLLDFNIWRTGFLNQTRGL